MMPPSTDSSASRLCGGTRRSASSIVAITPPHRSPAGPTASPGARFAQDGGRSTARDADARDDETFFRKLLQQPVERRAILLREPLPVPAGRRLEHQEVPE